MMGVIVIRALDSIHSFMKFSANGTPADSGGGRRTNDLSDEHVSISREAALKTNPLEGLSRGPIDIHTPELVALRETAFDTAIARKERIIQMLTDDGLRLSASLLASDLLMAADNAYCISNVNKYKLPARKAGMTQAAYEELINIFQSVSFCFYQNPDRYCAKMAQLNAGFLAHVFASQELTVPSFQWDPGQNRLTLKPGYGLQPIKCEFKPGESLFFPGTGLVFFSDLTTLARLPGQIFLNDTNPYVNENLKKMIELFGLNHVKVLEGNFGEIQFPGHSIKMMMVSMVYEAGESALQSLINHAAGFMQQSGKVIFFSPDSKSKPTDVETETLKRLATASGFRLTFSHTIRSNTTRFWFERGPWLLELNARRLFEVLPRLEGTSVPTQTTLFTAVRK